MLTGLIMLSSPSAASPTRLRGEPAPFRGSEKTSPRSIHNSLSPPAESGWPKVMGAVPVPSTLLTAWLTASLLAPGLGLPQTETKLIACDAGGTVIAAWEVSQ